MCSIIGNLGVNAWPERLNVNAENNTYLTNIRDRLKKEKMIEMAHLFRADSGRQRIGIVICRTTGPNEMFTTYEG